MIETSVVSGVSASRELREIDAPVRIHRQPRHAEAFPLLQMLERVQHGVMLGGAGDEMLARAPRAPARGR